MVCKKVFIKLYCEWSVTVCLDNYTANAP